VDPEHREDLEALMDLLRVAIELESSCDFGERADSGSGGGSSDGSAGGAGDSQNRAAFFAHFRELETALQEWDECVERLRAAPGSLWRWLARSTASRCLSEPQYSVGALIDRLAILTIERARHGRLTTRHKLYVQCFIDRSGKAELMSLYVEGQNVARVPAEPEATVAQRTDHAAELIQRLFDDAQTSSEAAEIASARDALLEIKQPLLDRLTLAASVDAISFSPACPRCQAALQATIQE